MDLKTLLYEKEAGIGIVTFNRPQVLNALNEDALMEIVQVMDQISCDDEVKCVILTGNEKAFVAGADVAYMSQINPLECEKFMVLVHKAMNRISNLNKPVIAAMAGFVLGGGCEIALACDLRLAAEGTRFGFPEINLGLFPAGGGTQRLGRVVGFGWAKDLILTGDTIDAATALKIGLITRVFPAEVLLVEAKKVAAKLAAKSPVTMRVAKQCLNMSISTDLASGLLHEERGFSFLFSTEDHLEGMKAFLEKRKPVFKGC